MRELCTLALMLLIADPAGAQRREPVEYFPVGKAVAEASRAAGSPIAFSSAVRVGNVLHLSGQIGVRPDGKLPQGIEAQTRQTMENIRSVLAGAGLSFENVFKCTVMLERMEDWPAFNRLYVQYFEQNRLPARSALGADGLALGALVELECLAHVPAKRAERRR